MAAFFEHAGYGVDIFFAISGFLIVSLLLQEKSAFGTIDLFGFYKRRVFRILPPMIVYLSFLAVLSVLGVLAIPWADIAASLFFYRNYAGSSWYTAHFWSLAIEEHFYLVVPIVVYILKRRQALGVFVVATIACIVIRFVESIMIEGTKVEFRTESRFDALMYGSIAAILASYPRGRAWLNKHMTLPKLSVVLLISLALLFFLKGMPARRTIVAIVIPMIILRTVLHPQSFVSCILEMRPLRWVGRLSYSIYIWQMLFLPPSPEYQTLQSFPLAFIATALLATMSYYWIEKPAIAFGRRRSPRLLPAAH